MHPLRFGLKLSQNAPIDTLTAIWRIADDSGFDHCWNMDHFASLGGDDTLDIFEAWTLLAGMARGLRAGALSESTDGRKW